MPNEDVELRRTVLRALLGSIGELTQIKSLFSCDCVMEPPRRPRWFLNYRCVFLDCNSIRIGDDVQIGPGVQIHTALHPLDARSRRSGLEADRWSPRLAWLIVLIRPGVSIDVGAYSFVVRDLPANVLAVGNPCKVLRQLYSPRKFVATKFARRPAHETWWFQCLSASTTLRDLSLIQRHS